MHFASMHNQKKDNNKFKHKNNQNCQKIELYGSPTIKELKKKHSSRLVGGAETGNWGKEDVWRGGWWTRQSHICVQINWEEQLGSEIGHATQDYSAEK